MLFPFRKLSFIQVFEFLLVIVILIIEICIGLPEFDSDISTGIFSFDFEIGNIVKHITSAFCFEVRPNGGK